MWSSSQRSVSILRAGVELDLALSSTSEHCCPKCGGGRSVAQSRLGSWGGYWGWAVIGYGLGLGITLAANVYGWTFNGVHGQPALLYLVPAVLGALAYRAFLRGQLGPLWSGVWLSRPAADADSVPTYEAHTVPADSLNAAAPLVGSQLRPCCSCEYKQH